MIPITCPQCGSHDVWERGDRFYCKSCGTTSEDDTPDQEIQPPSEQIQVIPPAPQPIPQQEPSHPTRETIRIDPGYIFLALWALCGAILFCGPLLQRTEHPVTVDNQGNYVVPTIDCTENTPVMVQFGLDEVGTMLVAYPQVDGQNRWQISPSVADAITRSQDRSNRPFVNVVCNSNRSIAATGVIPLPQDGQLVVFAQTP